MPSQSTANSFRTLAYFFLGFFLVIVAVYASVPSILSSERGKKWLVETINNRIPGSVTITNTSFSLFGVQQIDGLVLSDPEGKEVFSVKDLTLDHSFLSFLWNRDFLGQMSVHDLNAEILPQKESINLYRSLGIRHAQMSEKTLPVTLKGLNVKLSDPNGKGQYRSTLSGKTLYAGKQGGFEISATQPSSDISSLVNHSPGEVNIDLDNFPVVLIDIAASLVRKEASKEYHALFGDILNLSLKHKKTLLSENIQLSGSSPLMQATFSGSIEGDVVRMDQPSELSWQLPPAAANLFLHRLLKKPRVRFKRSVKAKVKLDALHLPVAFFHRHPSDIDSSQIILQALVSVAESELESMKGQSNVAVEGVSLAISGPAESKKLSLNFEAKAKQNQHPVSVKLSGSIEKPLHIAGIIDSIKKEARLKLETIGLGNLIGIISDSPIDDRGKGVFAIDVSNDEFKGKLQYQSDLLEISATEFEGIIKDKIVSWEGSPAISFRVAPPLINPLLASNGNLTVLNDVIGQLKLGEFKANGFFLADADVHLRPFKVFLTPINEVVEIVEGQSKVNIPKNFKLDLYSEGITYQLSCKIKPTDGGVFQDLFGKQANTNIYGKVNFVEDGTTDASDITLTVSSDVSDLTAAGRLSSKVGFMMTEPIQLSVRLTPKVLATLLPQRKKPIPLHDSAILNLTINQPDNPIDLKNYNHIYLSGQMIIPELTFSETGPMRAATFKNVVVPWELSGPSNRIRFEFRAKTSLEDTSRYGTVNGKVTLTNWLVDNNPSIKDSTIQTRIFADNLPVALLKIIAEEETLTTILGESIDVNMTAKVRLTPEPTGTVDLSLEGEELSGSAALNLGKTFTLRDDKYPAWLKMKLTPERFEAIRILVRKGAVTKAKIRLAKDAQLEAYIRQLTLPRNLENGFPIGNSTADLDIVGKNFTIIDVERKESFSFPHLHAVCKTENLAEEIDFSIHAEETVAGENAGKIDLKGSIEKMLTEDGSLNRQTLTLNLSGSTRHLPIGLFSRFIRLAPGLDKKVEAVLGTFVDADLNVKVREMSGPVYAKVTGKNGQLLLDGKVLQGVLTLNKTFEAQVAATPELGQYIFKDVLPILSSITTGDSPLNLRIDPNGFSFPLRTMVLSEIQVGGATLTLGKMRFRNEGAISSLLKILNDSNNPHLSLWCTPCFFNVTNGVIGIARMDVLVADNYPIAVWGKVDLPADKIHLNVGLSGPALSKAFNIGGLGKNVMVTLPLKGTIGKANINKTKAMTKLASLAVKKGGDAKGVLFGTMLDIATGNILDPSIPPPTTNPLPWEPLITENTSQPATPTKETPSTTINPVKEVKKEAQKLIKKIFK